MSINNLSDLPVEILQLVFIRLEPHFLSTVIRIVCKRFCSILTDDGFWKRIYLKQVGSRIELPLLKTYGLDDDYSYIKDYEWKDLAVELNLDQKWNQDLKIFKKQSPHFGNIDCIRFLSEDLCLSGGRDKILAVWNLEYENPSCVCYDSKAHDGWIWDLDSYDKDHFFSAGWDSCIKFWSLRESSISKIKSYFCEKPVMAIASQRNLIIAGLSNLPRVLLIDPRIESIQENIKLNNIHKASVTGLKTIENGFVSISEDKNVSAFDLRNKRFFFKTKIQNNNAFPNALTIQNGLILIGDSKGALHIYEQKSYNKLLCLNLPTSKPISSIVAKKGEIIVGSTDHFVRTILPSEPYKCINEFQFEGDVTAVQYKNNLMAIAAGNNITFMFI